MDDPVSPTQTQIWDVVRRSPTGRQVVAMALRARFPSWPSLTAGSVLRPGMGARSRSTADSAARQCSSAGAAPQASITNGAAFAGYTILRPLGAGAMAEVYLAKHPRLPRHDVLKVLAERFTADGEFRERFNREADLAAALWHPHIVGLHDRGEFDGQLWISMDYVEGTDAARLVREHHPEGMPLADVRAITGAVANALDYAHDRGLLHRDVKPANILLTNPCGGERRILLADFGVARHLGDVCGITATNVAVGTVSYAAPEQLMGSNLDGRADQYALAATAFHLLTGSPPYEQSNPVAVISQHLRAEPPRLSDHRPDLAHLDGVFCKALAKRPEERFERCRAFTAALGAQAGGVSSAVHGERHATKDRKAWSLKAHAAIASVCVALVVSATGWSAMRAFEVKPQTNTFPTLARSVTTGPVPPVSPAPHPVASAVSSPQLSGAYRLAFAPAKSTGSGGLPGHKLVQTSWWAFRSSCAATGCVATGARLDDDNHQVASITGGGQTDVLRFIDGYWQGAPTQVRLGCYLPGRAGTSTQMETIVWSLAPGADGTLHGMQTDTVETNECAEQGVVSRVSLVATRIGNVPPNVTLADPAAVANAPEPAAVTSSAPVLGAACSDTDKLGYDLTTNQQVVCEDKRWDKAPVTMGVHAAGTSCAQPDIPVFAMSASDDGYLIECDPATRLWTRQ